MRAGVALICTVALAGCATKNYGRLMPLSGAEEAAYTCEQIKLELAKVDTFDNQVKQNSKTNTSSVLGFLGDFGIGNSMEKGSAERSSSERREQLNKLAATKNCNS